MLWNKTWRAELWNRKYSHFYLKSLSECLCSSRKAKMRTVLKSKFSEILFLATSLFFTWWWFSCQVMFNSCNPLDYSPPDSSVHGIFQARILEWVAIPFSRESPDPRIKPGSIVCSNSCPLSQWCYLTISSSATPSPFGFNLSQHQGLFQLVRASHQVAKVLELRFQHQPFQWIFRIDFL